jgi:cation:H+ antiporter
MPQLPFIVHIILIIAGSITLVQAVKAFINSSSKIAKKIGISGYTISFLLVAVATSLPEVVVGITSALEGNSILSFGNAIGSNVALITLVVALPVLFSGQPGISTRTIIHSKDAYYTLFFGILPIALAVDGKLNRTDGIILIILYLVYFIIVWRRSHGVEKIIEQLGEINLWKQGILFLISLLLLLASSEVIVQSAMSLSLGLGWKLAFIGLSITAIGTSLPEIAFTIGAAKGRFQQEILGDIVGSLVANSTLVLGLTSVIHPISLTNGSQGYSLIVLFTLIMLIFLSFVRSREKIDKAEAVFLIVLYILFIAAEYYLQTNSIF